MLLGRQAEQLIVDELLDSARAGRSAVMVIRGEPGIGKSALLDYARSHAAGMTVLRSVGIEAEHELPFAALHQLLRPCLGLQERLPVPQAAALRGAFTPSNMVDVETKDVFPPKPPQQVVAVATEGAVDLSWAANTELDLAGYIVYRSESGAKPKRISPSGAPLIAPAFRDTSAMAGHTYRYSVSAVDTSGNESSWSSDAEETLPQ